MKKSFVISGIVIVLLVPLLVNNVQVHGQSGQALPTSLNIEGTIVDNYANITHAYEFDNSASADDTLIAFSTGSPKGLYLSNTSVSMGGVNYWGKVSPIQQARDIFVNATQANKSAVLVTKLGDIYQFEINVKAGETMQMVNYFEGYIARHLGEYTVEIYDPVSLLGEQVDLTIDILLKSTGSDILKARPNLSEYQRIPLPNGKQILVNQPAMTMDEQLIISYTMSQLDVGGKLLTYSNGTDNFFMYMLAPEVYSVDEIEAREFIFVLDISGSMGGQKIEDAKNAFAAMIETMNTNDLFNVISFNSAPVPLWDFSHVASTINVDEAVEWVLALSAGGGTNINDAMLSALNSFVGEANAQVVTLLSDGQGSNPQQIVRDNVLTANQEHAAVFTVGFGNGADEELLGGLAFDNGGEYIFIEPGANAIDQLSTFYDTFSTPVALGFSVDYVNAFDIYPGADTLPQTLFNGTEILQTGRFDGDLQITTTMTYSTGDEIYQNAATTPSTQNQHIERIWAINSVNQLLKMERAGLLSVELEDIITNLAVYYGIVVDGYTGMTIVVEEQTDSIPPDEPTDSSYGGVDAVPPPVMDVTSTVTHAGSQVVENVDETVDELANATDDALGISPFNGLILFVLLGLSFFVRYSSKKKLNS